MRAQTKFARLGIAALLLHSSVVRAHSCREFVDHVLREAQLPVLHEIGRGPFVTSGEGDDSPAPFITVIASHPKQGVLSKLSTQTEDKDGNRWSLEWVVPPMGHLIYHFSVVEIDDKKTCVLHSIEDVTHARKHPVGQCARDTKISPEVQQACEIGKPYVVHRHTRYNVKGPTGSADQGAGTAQ